MGTLDIGIEAVERGVVPDFFTRLAIRQLCSLRAREAAICRVNGLPLAQVAFVESMRSGPIAMVPEMANQQHYEVPPEFFGLVLGPMRKYSCCYFSSDKSTLAEAEHEALRITCARAGLSNGEEILELGCGWGSLSLWMARHYPDSQITAVSNSTSQRKFIESQAVSAGISNLHVVTADINDFSPSGKTFDRVVSVEMFEHLRNYDVLLSRIASWLRPGGRLFVHIFCHQNLVYPFDTEGAANWMGRHFFTGGIMPSADLLTQFNQSMRVIEQHHWNGSHYQRTAEAWLSNLDANRREVLRVLASTYGTAQSNRWLNRWRMFFLAVAELFGYGRGEEWFVSHYLLQPVN